MEQSHRVTSHPVDDLLGSVNCTFAEVSSEKDNMSIASLLTLVEDGVILAGLQGGCDCLPVVGQNSLQVVLYQHLGGCGKITDTEKEARETNLRQRSGIIPAAISHPSYQRAGGAVKAMKAQFLTVQMSREVLEDGGGACDRNITGAAYQHLDGANIDQEEMLTLSQKCFQILEGDNLVV
ncbi:hypothetical protein EYF80_007797 [Liparis tanakae]|uniref:Uncharacterized protein n=1 Tax=Liparis tanakae TaxID=230148 RepID=A0A4Z2IV66_9TELE|nr:hypothetical protein EYF80_007797 [Liparis tanakae]